MNVTCENGESFGLRIALVIKKKLHGFSQCFEFLVSSFLFILLA